MSAHLLPKRNNFDLLRLLFAVTVFVTHLYELSGIAALKIIPKTFSYVFLTSGRAVQGFFVISGFLVFMSFERSTTMRTYFEKRVRRLYPGYAFNVVFSAIALALVSTYSLKAYFLGGQFWRFLAFNLTFLNAHQWTLPGVFESNRFTAANGALWTLPIEVLFYITVPLIALLGKKIGKLPALLAIYACSSAYLSWNTWTGHEQIALQFPSQLCYFVAGSLLYCFFEFASRNRHSLLLLAIVVFAVHQLTPLTYLLPLALGIIVIYVGCFFPHLGHASKYGDLSYAIYIYHFPIIQTLIILLPNRQPLPLLIAAVLLVPSFALLSWHLVEKRFLLQSSHYLRKATPAETMESMTGVP